MLSLKCNCGGYEQEFDCSAVEWEKDTQYQGGPNVEPRVEWTGTYEAVCPKCGKMVSAVFVVWENPEGQVQSKSTKHFFCQVEGFCFPEGLDPQ